MEVTRAMRHAGVLRMIGLGAAALWLGSAVTLALPKVAHAQDGSAVSGGNGPDDDGAAIDTDAATIDPNVAPATIAGSWSGSVSDKRLGAGAFTVTFTQNEGSKVVVASPWDVDFANDTGAGGTGSGKVKGKSLKLVLFDPTISSKCRMTVSAKIIVDSGTAEEIKGKYSIKKCFDKPSSGQIDLTPSS